MIVLLLPAVIIGAAFATEHKLIVPLAIIVAGGFGRLLDPFAMVIAFVPAWKRWGHAKWAIVTLGAGLLYGLGTAALPIDGRTAFQRDLESLVRGISLTVLSMFWLGAIIHFARGRLETPVAATDDA